MKTLDEYKKIVEQRLNELIVPDGSRILDAMRYSLLAGGKRLRASMMLCVGEMFSDISVQLLDYACAVEMIHAYTLIHDDLPCMDNDNLRRGKPTNHVVFGEAQAMLAGDGLLNYAYEMMLKASIAGDGGVRAIYEIAQAAGAYGVVGGQSVDLISEREVRGGREELEYIQLNKTAKLFIGPLRAAAILSGASEEQIDAITRYAEAFGRLFQTTDDLLDVYSTVEELGKSIGKDAEENKLTMVSEYGAEGARQKAEEYSRAALDALSIFDEKAELLRELARKMLTRRS